MPKVSLQLNFTHTNLPVSVDHSIGSISVADSKWCVSVDGKHLLGEIQQLLLDDFSMQISLKPSNYGENVFFS